MVTFFPLRSKKGNSARTRPLHVRGFFFSTYAQMFSRWADFTYIPNSSAAGSDANLLLPSSVVRHRGLKFRINHCIYNPFGINQWIERLSCWNFFFHLVLIVAISTNQFNTGSSPVFWTIKGNTSYKFSAFSNIQSFLYWNLYLILI